MELKVIRLANGCIFWRYRNISEVYILILPTISKGKQIPRFIWEWSRMHKQSIPGHLSPPTRPGYEANHDHTRLFQQRAQGDLVMFSRVPDLEFMTLNICSTFKKCSPTSYTNTTMNHLSFSIHRTHSHPPTYTHMHSHPPTHTCTRIHTHLHTSFFGRLFLFLLPSSGLICL